MRSLRVALPAAVVGLAVAFLVAGAGSAQQPTRRAVVAGLAADGIRTATAPTATPTPTLTPIVTQVVGAEVAIQGFAFSPNSVTIRKGERVLWTHKDGGTQHGIVANDFSFQSPIGSSGLMYSHLFEATGTYPYRCSVHSFMTGAVVVTE